MKAKKQTPTIEQENAALIQERDHWKNRAGENGKAVSEFCVLAHTQAGDIEKLQTEIERLKRELKAARLN